MISGLIMTSRLESNLGPVQVSYELDPYDRAEGPIRAMQKFVVILMTTIGTDPLRPWFGTQVPQLCRMNIVDRAETRIFVQEQVSEAIRQFFKLQSGEYSQNVQSADDIITAIELVDLNIDTRNNISLKVKFTPARYSAIVYSMKIL